ncbi:hypothetical protein TNCT_71181 [Trichonephila clavata]|uniref:Uncharacterized protein n=1 Tax=Trichonephila clavata TaxID=2740835 RepID=A0A8X6L2E6_TRICU|nr:hypothetical protein TNCT_71181 [Trichonephila clavata]
MISGTLDNSEDDSSGRNEKVKRFTSQRKRKGQGLAEQLVIFLKENLLVERTWIKTVQKILRKYGYLAIKKTNSVNST